MFTCRNCGGHDDSATRYEAYATVIVCADCGHEVHVYLGD